MSHGTACSAVDRLSSASTSVRPRRAPASGEGDPDPSQPAESSSPGSACRRRPAGDQPRAGPASTQPARAIAGSPGHDGSASALRASPGSPDSAPHGPSSGWLLGSRFSGFRAPTRGSDTASGSIAARLQAPARVLALAQAGLRLRLELGIQAARLAGLGSAQRVRARPTGSGVGSWSGSGSATVLERKPAQPGRTEVVHQRPRYRGSHAGASARPARAGTRVRVRFGFGLGLGFRFGLGLRFWLQLRRVSAPRVLVRTLGLAPRQAGGVGAASSAGQASATVAACRSGTGSGSFWRSRCAPQATGRPTALSPRAVLSGD